MSFASEDDHVRLTLEVAPGGEAVRVVLMSKRFERLQAARARAMERASRPTRAAASSVSARSGAPTTSTTSQDDVSRRAPSRGSSSRRPDLHRGRDAPARWWEVPDASETDRRGDAPEAATREGGETARDRRCDSGKKKTSQRFSRPTPADEERKRDDGDDDDDDACAGSAARARAIHLLCATDARTREKAAKEPRAFSRPAAVTAAPPRARLKARSAAAASASARADENARENGAVTKKTNSPAVRVGGVPSSLALAQCAACGRRNYGVAVSKRDAARGPASRRDGSWRSRDARATAGVLGKGARRVTVAKTFTSTSASKKNHPSDEYLVPVVEFVPCARCGDAWYCDRACVESDWPRHRKLCAGVRCSFAPRDGDLSAGDVDLGYARGERFGSEAFRNAFLETSVARGTKWG